MLIQMLKKHESRDMLLLLSEQLSEKYCYNNFTTLSIYFHSLR